MIDGMRILVAGVLVTLGIVLADKAGTGNPYTLVFIGLFILFLWSILK